MADSLDFFQKLCAENTFKKNEAKEKLPKVLAVYRAKVLKALGKCDDQIDTEQDLSLDGLFWKPMCDDANVRSDFFDDSILVAEFQKFKAPHFDLTKYIVCVKVILHAYLGTDSKCYSFVNMKKALSYVLAHSRDFNNPNTQLFKFSADGTEEIEVDDVKEDTMNKEIPGNQRYIEQLNKLMNDLLNSYDETKYKKLNLNVTYLILFMAKRCCRNKNDIEKSLKSNKVHEDYATLCPMHFVGCRLSLISQRANESWEHYVKHENFILLLLYGYLKSVRITRRVFRATCISHMEYNGLALPMLFDKVSDLYNVPKDTLWDVISQCKDHDVLQALFTMADYYYAMYEAGGTKTYELFPFCRVYNQYYHNNMSGKLHQNFKVCFALALLIDKKLGMDKSFVRKSGWSNAFSTIWQSKASVIAAEVLEKISD